MTTHVLEVDHVSIAYGDNTVVEDVSFQLVKGEIGCLLGPSGCGKTTLLRSIAGFEPLHNGVIRLNGNIVSDHRVNCPPEKRKIGMVFQDFALFPHLTIEKNIAFGLQNLSRKQRQQRVEQLLEMIALEGYGNRYPHELSGGQQQRIALARALAPKPELLLMDEPFSSMDIELREELAKEVREIIKQENITAILVTHDQHEAFAVADVIGVMQQGKLIQWADDYTLYHRPATTFVANFIGHGVFLEGEVINDSEIKTELATLQGKVPEQCNIGCKVDIFIRPDDILIDNNSGQQVMISAREFKGSDFLYTLRLTDGTRLLTLEHSHHRYEVGEKVGIVLELDHVVVFPKKA